MLFTMSFYKVNKNHLIKRMPPEASGSSGLYLSKIQIFYILRNQVLFRLQLNFSQFLNGLIVTIFMLRWVLNP